MEFLRTALDRALHLNVYLPIWADQMGPWLYVVLFAVIFCETGLVVTPFLPGDSLLFAVGAVIALSTSTLNLPLMLAVLIAAAILGDAANYALGLKLGPAVFRSDRSWLFHRKHLLRTQDFYARYGGKTIILARFIPIIRTFAPFVAGIGKMEYRHFVVFNATGGILWVMICVFSGYWFGSYEFIQKNFELVIVAIVLISIMPMVVEFRPGPTASGPARGLKGRRDESARAGAQRSRDPRAGRDRAGRPRAVTGGTPGKNRRTMLAESTDPLTTAPPAVRSPSSRGSLKRFVPVIVWGVWAAMFVALLGFVYGLGRNIPFNDDWDVLPWVSGQRPVDLAWLWRPHNEHRIPLPKAVWVILGRLTGCDLRAGMLLDAALLGGITAALIRTAARLRGRTVLTDAFFPLALLHWGQHQTLLWSFEVQFVSSAVLTLLILLILVSVRGFPTLPQGLVVGGCLVVLPLCGANGLVVVPPLAAWLVVAGVVSWRSGRTHGRRDAVMWMGLAASALALVTLAILGEKGGATHTPRPSVTALMQTICQFLAMAVGPGGEMGVPVSALVLVFLLVLCALPIAGTIRRRPDQRWRSSGLLCYLVALLGLGLAVAWGRADFGGVTARYGTRFVTLAMPLVCWCYFAATLSPNRSAPLRAIPWVLCVSMLALLPLNIREGLYYGRGHASGLSAVEADIRDGVSPEEVARRWQGRLHLTAAADPTPHRRWVRDCLEWLRQTGQGPYKGQSSP